MVVSLLHAAVEGNGGLLPAHGEREVHIHVLPVIIIIMISSLLLLCHHFYYDVIIITIISLLHAAVEGNGGLLPAHGEREVHVNVLPVIIIIIMSSLLL
jgi:hypothetical protein